MNNSEVDELKSENEYLQEKINKRDARIEELKLQIRNCTSPLVPATPSILQSGSLNSVVGASANSANNFDLDLTIDQLLNNNAIDQIFNNNGINTAAGFVSSADAPAPPPHVTQDVAANVLDDATEAAGLTTEKLRELLEHIGNNQV